MALTIDVIRRVRMPAGRAVVADITFDNSYPTGGEALAAADVGLSKIEYVRAEQKGVANRICEYDYANSKLLLFTALGTQAANASDQSAIVVRALILADHFTGLEQ